MNWVKLNEKSILFEYRVFKKYIVVFLLKIAVDFLGLEAYF